MLRKLFLGAAVAVTALVMSGTASADHNRCYRGGYGGGYATVYRAPVVNYGRSPYYSGYRGYSSPYRSFYGSPYRSGFYGGGYGYGSPYYGRGSYVGFGRGGISIGIGF